MILKSVLLVVCCIASLAFSSDRSEDVELQMVTSAEWADIIRQNGKLLVVFYKETGCPSCEATIELVTTLHGDPELDQDLLLGKSTDLTLAADLGIYSFPTTVYLRESSIVIYDGKPTVEGIFEWLELSRSKVTQHLHDDSFEHLTQASTGATTGDWLVAFYQEKCKNILPIMESIGVRIRQKTNVAVVDYSSNKVLADRFSIKKCPEIILFKQGKMYRYEIPRIDQASLKSFVDVWHKNSKAETVLPPKSKFDHLTESIAILLKSQLQGKNRSLVIGGLSAVIGFFGIVVIFCCCRSSGGKHKME